MNIGSMVQNAITDFTGTTELIKDIGTAKKLLLGGSQIQGLLGKFVFFMNDVSYQKMSENMEFGWSKKDRIGNNPLHQATGGYSRSFSISGTLVLKSVRALEELQDIARKKQPVTLVLPSTWRVYKVVITSLNIEKDTFIGYGLEARKSFTVNLEEYYGNTNTTNPLSLL